MPDRGGFDFKPIRNEADLAAATTQVARLWGAAIMALLIS